MVWAAEHIQRVGIYAVALPTGGWNCRYDYVTVKQENQWQSWGPYCGTDLPQNFTTRGTTVIKFHSDYVIERPGFLAKYTIESEVQEIFIL